MPVHEADKDAVVVEEGGHLGDAAQDELQVVDALPALLEHHGPRVVCAPPPARPSDSQTVRCITAQDHLMRPS